MDLQKEYKQKERELKQSYKAIEDVKGEMQRISAETSEVRSAVNKVTRNMSRMKKANKGV